MYQKEMKIVVLLALFAHLSYRCVCITRVMILDGWFYEEIYPSLPEQKNNRLTFRCAIIWSFLNEMGRDR